ncbi:BUD13 homolog [Chironomus tepperi]|uniref:BUD13 homolog n=1 Tax=Chironomus tepperi TaxID=113505 RepID=UPI00391F2113
MNKKDQKEYLKRYLCTDEKLEKKKKKKSKDKCAKIVKKTVKIIDDDASDFKKNEDIDEGDLYATNEEAPQIVGFIDERSATVIMKQEYEQSGKWKSLDNHKNECKNKEEFRKQVSDENLIRSKKNSSSSRTKTFDESPPRRKIRHSDDESPPRRNRRKSDESPPRRNRRKSDESPPRRNRRKSDESPPRHEVYKQNISPQNLLLKIKKERESLSPSNYYIRSSKSPEDVKRHIKIENDNSSPQRPLKMSKTLDGKASGLQNAKSLKDENEKFRERQDKLFKEMKPEFSGKNADVTIRDRKGRNKDYEYDLEKERRKIKEEEERKKEYDRWGKGLKQLEEIEKRRREYLHEANKPLARDQDDKDLQDFLKNKELSDDPMLQYIRRKRKEENVKKGIVEKPQYNGDFPDNRFNIKPGYRWDGVDRSNGYEKKYFSMINSKKSQEEEAYRYSTEDM